MPRYRITNTETGEVEVVTADRLDIAVSTLKWSLDKTECEILPPLEKPKQPKKKKKTSEHRKAAIAQEKKEAATVHKIPSQTLVVSPEAAVIIEQIEGATARELTDEEKAAITEMDEVIEAAPVESVVGQPTEAEKVAYAHKQLIEALALEAEVMFLRMGQLFYEAREKGEWTILHYESFKDYCEDLKLPVSNSYSWATRLSNIYQYLVKERGLNEKLLAEIGVAKLTRLLPLARKGELTDEVLEAARVLSDLDLRAELGHDVSGEDKPDYVVCPRCGEVFNSRTASRA